MESEFKCQRCGYITLYKSNMKVHLTSKRECKPILENISRNEILTELYVKKKKNYTCICGKAYSYSQGLSLHKKSCKHYKEKSIKELKEELKEELREELLEELKETTNPIGSITLNNNSNNSNNTNNIIIVNEFGSEDTSYLSPKLLDKCLSLMTQGIPHLTKAIHFNQDHPENHNIQVTNMRGSYVKVRKEEKWQYTDKNETIKTILWKHNDLLREHYNENEEKFREKWNDQKVNYIENWLNRIETEDPELWKRLSRECLYVLINNRDNI